MTGGCVLLHVCGLNHTCGGIEVRERFAIEPSRLTAVLEELKRSGIGGQILLLSTCNRTELYAFGTGPEFPARLREAYLTLGRRTAGGRAQTEVCATFPLYECSGADAVRHLFAVGAGLDSLILGETQIKQQIRLAYEASVSAGAAGADLHRLIEATHRVGKRVRSETELNAGTLDIGRASILQAERVLGGLEGKVCLVIGAGKIGRIALREIAARRPARLVIVNRTIERAQEAGEAIEAEAAPLDALPGLLAEADFVLGAAWAPDFVVTRDGFAAARRSPARAGAACLIDAAVPRILDPKIDGVDGARLFDIEHLSGIIEENRRRRTGAARRARAIVSEEAGAFERRAAEAGLGSRIQRVRELLAALFSEERTRIESCCPADAWPEVESRLRQLEGRVQHEAIEEIKSGGAASTA